MKKKILRIQENTIFWKFGYFCEDISRKEPGPPTVTGLNSQQHLTTLIEARAILCGNQGQLKLEFKIPTVKLGSPEYEFIEKILCDKAKKITEDQPSKCGWR